MKTSIVKCRNALTARCCDLRYSRELEILRAASPSVTPTSTPSRAPVICPPRMHRSLIYVVDDAHKIVLKGIGIMATSSKDGAHRHRIVAVMNSRKHYLALGSIGASATNNPTTKGAELNLHLPPTTRSRSLVIGVPKDGVLAKICCHKKKKCFLSWIPLYTRHFHLNFEQQAMLMAPIKRSLEIISSQENVR